MYGTWTQSNKYSSTEVTPPFTVSPAVCWSCPAPTPPPPQALLRVLDARQLGLKLLANTTYGYMAASFSGRMPCIEIGDSIVRKSRETLERAIRLVNSTREWGARVVYGDTDRWEVKVVGKSRHLSLLVSC